MFEKYISYLFKQYCDAKGFDIRNIEKIYSNDFMMWIRTNKDLLESYIEYLKIIGIDYEQKEVIEIGKGKYDSLSEHGIKVITPYASSMGKNYSRLMISNGDALVVSMYEIYKLEGKVLLTHNPYFKSDLSNWQIIHNKGNNDISIGVFGNIHDEDYKKKIKLLSNLSKKMTDDFKFDYDTCDDNYFCSLNSRRKTKIKVKTKG